MSVWWTLCFNARRRQQCPLQEISIQEGRSVCLSAPSQRITGRSRPVRLMIPPDQHPGLKEQDLSSVECPESSKAGHLTNKTKVKYSKNRIQHLKLESLPCNFTQFTVDLTQLNEWYGILINLNQIKKSY